ASTFAPSRPMPTLQPVITATLPFTSRSMPVSLRFYNRPMTTRVVLLAVAACLAILGMVRVGRGQSADTVRLQLKWVTQAQFAGYYAAQAKGLYAAEGLDVTIRPGGPDIVPEQVVAGGGAQFGIDWLPSLLAARDKGAPLTNIAQVFARSGMRELAFKTSGSKGAGDLRGRKVAVWVGGNEVG